MLKLNNKAENVEAVLLIDMLLNGEECEAGEVVEMSQREFKYLHHFVRVLPATEKNVAAVRASVKAKKDVAAKAAAKADELTDTKNQLAAALARIVELEKKGK
jgi:hypothetical protein